MHGVQVVTRPLSVCAAKACLHGVTPLGWQCVHLLLHEQIPSLTASPWHLHLYIRLSGYNYSPAP